MNGLDCVTFLQETLPRLGLHWLGFPKVRRQVYKRNLVFAYFDGTGQQEALGRILERVEVGRRAGHRYGRAVAG